MRQTVAKRLRREANQFARTTGRHTNVYKTFYHHKVKEIVMDELLPNGQPDIRKVDYTNERVVLTDGPRFFLKALKRAYTGKLLLIE